MFVVVAQKLISFQLLGNFEYALKLESFPGENCDKNRLSSVQKRRISGIENSGMQIRSKPKPNAQAISFFLPANHNELIHASI